LAAVALLMARFSTERASLFVVAILAGSGQISYWRFVALDAVGTVFYSTLWIVLGALFGAAVLERTGPSCECSSAACPPRSSAFSRTGLVRRRRYGPRRARSGLRPLTASLARVIASAMLGQKERWRWGRSLDGT
jgi:hypothetical protein